jgi:hypothetical protein
MPNKPVEYIALHDASIDDSLVYVQRRLNLPSNEELRGYISALGGRRTDLELFIQKIKAGSTSENAFNEIVSKSVSELRKTGLGEEDIAGKKAPWTPAQFWKVIQQLSKYEMVDYDELRQHALFKGNELPVQYMENAGLITIDQINGRPKIIRPGRPVYKAAFQQMTSDHKLTAFMGIQMIKTMRADLDTKIKENEAEMGEIVKILSGYGTNSKFITRQIRNQLEQRLKYLGVLIEEFHKKVAIWTDEERDFKKVLKLKD